MDYLLPAADLLPNFALKSQGAKVLQWMPLAAHPGQLQRCGWFGFALEEPFIHPDIVIQGRTRLNPGECWAFEGSQGHLAIALSHRVLISHVTLGHLPKMLSPTGNTWSAPKEFSVYGMREPEQEWTHLGTFIYEEDGDSLQTFELPLYTHSRLLEGAWKFAQPVYICFADLEKAFDCVPLGTLIVSLLVADDVVLLSSSGRDLQPSLEQFAAECEAARMRIGDLLDHCMTGV
ncbi:SUN domain-containing protein 3-like [Xiphophorus hellerii]|uniref:SUN domain-containing protein 3-like n=1 Tax=Xiphophorus hellerii TaxID=8084 RepID=UPI0013B399DF|nr:SUN domain-containing protein 3-like [Xiphophorus hellerii]